MMSIMRTTLTIEDDLAHALKERAFRTGRSFKAVVNDALRAGLDAAQAPSNPKRYRLKPASLGGLRPGVDLDRALRLAETLEDREIGRKLEQRK
jgi:plasmid stability protein